MSDNNPIGLPAPASTGNHEDPPRDEPEGTGRNRRHRIPTAEDCLVALHQLAGLVTLGLIRPAQANAIRSSLSEILRYLGRANGESPTAVPVNEQILDELRKNPNLQRVFGPLLTDEQVENLLQGGSH